MKLFCSSSTYRLPHCGGGKELDSNLIDAVVLQVRLLPPRPWATAVAAGALFSILALGEWMGEKTVAVTIYIYSPLIRNAAAKLTRAKRSHTWNYLPQAATVSSYFRVLYALFSPSMKSLSIWS